jgi:nicotinate-nucleotide adenylyltransferase
MAKYSLLSVRRSKMRVGILGGSFNPPHEGHKYISEQAIKRLNLDYIVWLITPQNPHKALQIADTLDERMRLARELTADNRRIIISDIEKHQKEQYTAFTISRLCKMHPETQFFWIIGVDCMQHIHRWQCWKDIFAKIPVVIFDRMHYCHPTRLKAGMCFKSYQITTKSGAHFGGTQRWCFFKIRCNPMSSTQLRRN